MSGENKKKKWLIVLLVAGIVTLAVGVSILIVRLVTRPAVLDSEFLISSGEWVREDAPSVIWDFAEAGKGSLTTDGHINDYDFAWEIDDSKLIIMTKWLYELSDEFDYTLDQGAKTLVIKNEDKGVEVKFRIAENNGS